MIPAVAHTGTTVIGEKRKERKTIKNQNILEESKIYYQWCVEMATK